jgi:hypothetical protein
MRLAPGFSLGTGGRGAFAAPTSDRGGAGAQGGSMENRAASALAASALAASALAASALAASALAASALAASALAASASSALALMKTGSHLRIAPCVGASEESCAGRRVYL